VTQPRLRFFWSLLVETFIYYFFMLSFLYVHYIKYLTWWVALLLGGTDSSHHPLSTVQLVDFATGMCTPQPHLLRSRIYPAAARLPDGRVVCAGDIGGGVPSSAEIWGPPEQGAQDAAWTWTMLPVMSAACAVQPQWMRDE